MFSRSKATSQRWSLLQ